MTKLLWPTVVGAAISAVSLLGFIYLSASAMDEFKYAAVLLYVAATAALFWLMTRSMGLYALIGLGVMIALGSDLVWLVFGYCCFPGLVKDVDAFSLDQLNRLVVSVPMTVAWYGLIAVGAYAAARLGAAVRRQ
jgi:hypothetical protein